MSLAENQLLPEDIFNDALEIASAEERREFLAKACRGDDDLLSMLEEMLEIATRTPNLLSEPLQRTIPEKLGNFQLLEEIGRGGMGVVYKARDNTLGRIVAMKVLHTPLMVIPGTGDRFEREARMLATLAHDNIATTYFFGVQENLQYLVMEYIEGRSLRDKLKGGPLSLKETVQLAEQLCCALDAAHRHQIVHLDLKPDNIMIRPDGRIKVLDFGIARVLTEGAMSPETGKGNHPQTLPCGTPAYMAPEQAEGGRIDERADIWALGCILEECLTGIKRPAEGSANAPQSIVPLPRSTPKPLKDILARCHASTPDQRPDSVREVQNVFNRLQRQESRRRRVLVYGIPLAMSLLLWPVISRWQKVETPLLARVEVTDNAKVLKGIAEDGVLLWTHRLDAKLAMRPNSNGGLPYIHFESGKPEGIYGLTREHTLKWSPETGDVAWRNPVTWQEPANALGEGIFLDCYWESGTDSEDPLILAGIHDGIWYGYALAITELDGSIVGHYYHPGPISRYYDLPEKPGTPSRGLIIGINSSARFRKDLVPFETDRHCGFAALIQPRLLSGQAYPYSSAIPEGRDWPEMPRANEVAYLVIPPVSPVIWSAAYQAQVEDRDGDLAITLGTRDGRHFLLDSRLIPQGVYLRVDSPADSLRILGEAQFLPLLHISGGESTWYDVPFID